MALGATFAALEHGLKVPRDLSIIGFGDLAYFCSPALSTVRIPAEQLGLAAVQVLRERLAQPMSPLKRLLLPAEFIPRASCGSPPAASVSAAVPMHASSNGTASNLTSTNNGNGSSVIVNTPHAVASPAQ
jgi:hypothetical protein